MEKRERTSEMYRVLQKAVQVCNTLHIIKAYYWVNYLELFVSHCCRH